MTSWSEELQLSDKPPGLDKYDLRAWLIGWAVLHGGSYEAESDLVGVLRRGGESVTLAMYADGLGIGGRLFARP